MPKPIPLKRVLRILGEHGFLFISQKGSHAKFKKKGSPSRIVILKITKKEIPHGTFYQSILPNSGLGEDDFLKK